MRSPGRSGRAGFALCSFTRTLPPLQAAAASARLLKSRAAQSHLSVRTESAEGAFISAGRRPWPLRPGTGSAERQLQVRPEDVRVMGSEGARPPEVRDRLVEEAPVSEPGAQVVVASRAPRVDLERVPPERLRVPPDLHLAPGLPAEADD